MFWSSMPPTNGLSEPHQSISLAFSWNYGEKYTAESPRRSKRLVQCARVTGKPSFKKPNYLLSTMQSQRKPYGVKRNCVSSTWGSFTVPALPDPASLL